MTTTKSPWWICAKCGFRNKPGPFRQDNKKCEQCGGDKDELSQDYKAGDS